MSTPQQRISPQYLNAYRPEIDGIRALAVCFVLLFHSFPGTFTGGFIGVDMFFVLSGFLISNHIFTEIDKGNGFNARQFFSRRIIRIFPALIAVLLCSLIAGWILLGESNLKRLTLEIFSGGLFTSNITYWLQSGYFDTTSAEKPLLHLWSLGVEEQFYIFLQY